MRHEPTCISFVSGKGGVGKTLLAANFAWVCSQVARTALVDLDFQNQGCSGLFAPHVSLEGGNALDYIKKDGTPDETFVQVSKTLSFLPAVSWRDRTSQIEIIAYTATEEFRQKLSAFVDRLKHTFDVVVLDCHGGVEAASLAAYQASDVTLMVTEADSVTFAGTLELLAHYKEEGGGSTPVKFIVNRLPSKYRWGDLEKIYGTYLGEKLLDLPMDRSVFCYIPSEELLAGSFGEYPFHAELAPRSIFSQKVHYNAYSLLDGGWIEANSYRPLTRFDSGRYRRRIERRVVSNEHRNTRAILAFFTWVCVLSAALFILSMSADIAAGWMSGDFYEPDMDVLGEPFLIAVGAIVIGAIFPLSWYFLRAVLGLMAYYKDRHRFERALYRSISPGGLTVWQRLALTKLLALRIGTTVLPYLAGASIVAVFLLGFALAAKESFR